MLGLSANIWTFAIGESRDVLTSSFAVGLVVAVASRVGRINKNVKLIPFIVLAGE